MATPDTLFRRGQEDFAASLPKSGGASGGQTGGTSWLNRALGRPDPHLQFDWEVSMQVGGLVHQPEYIESVNVPGVNVSTEPIYRAGRKIYIATSEDVGAVSVRMYEDVNFTSTKFLRTWHSLILAPNGDHGLPVQYKGHIEIYPTTPSGLLIAKIKCIGVFPTQNPPLAFTSENERTVLEMEFSCDTVEFEFYR